MDFVTHLPWTQQKHDAVWVIVDRSHEVGTFSSHADDFCLGEILPVIHLRESPATCSISIHSVG